jgi:Transcriptional regulator, AbiEi antitoxin
VGNQRQRLAEISRIAAGQHGHITRAQLRAIGLSERTIDRRIQSGALVRMHAGVYAVGYPRVEPVALAAAAVLASGDGAVPSHESAAALWGFRRWPRLPEVTVLTDRRPPGVRTHRSKTLTRVEIRTELGIRTTSAARTIADIVRRLTDRQLTRAIQDSRHARHIRPPDLEKLLRTCPRARALVDRTQNPTRSGLEDDFLRWIRRYKLPMPTINVKASGKEVDAWFHNERVVLEVDSWEYHGDPITFRSDAERGTAHAANGFLPLRLTDDRLTAVEAERLHGILARRPPTLVLRTSC